MYSPTTSPYAYSSFPKEESLVTIDFWRIFMGPFRLAVQSPSPRCSVLFASLLNLHWPRGEFTSARCLVTAGDSHKKNSRQK